MSKKKREEPNEKPGVVNLAELLDYTLGEGAAETIPGMFGFEVDNAIRKLAHQDIQKLGEEAFRNMIVLDMQILTRLIWHMRKALLFWDGRGGTSATPPTDYIQVADRIARVEDMMIGHIQAFSRFKHTEQLAKQSEQPEEPSDADVRKIMSVLRRVAQQGVQPAADGVVLESVPMNQRAVG